MAEKAAFLSQNSDGPISISNHAECEIKGASNMRKLNSTGARVIG